MVAVEVCSTAFTSLGRNQARALGFPELPIAVVPHPFGSRSRDEIRQIANICVDDIARLMCDTQTGERPKSTATRGMPRAQLIEAGESLEEVNRLFQERHWSDGLPIFPPTAARVATMLRATRRAPDEVIAAIAPAYGAASVEFIAINAVLAGCYPEYLPVLIAAAQAVACPEFNLQGLQATTNPATVWLIVNGPIVRKLGINSGGNCLGPGTWANATLGRGLRLMLQNVGGALPGEVDKSTHGQPGKFTFCCAENEAANPWQSLAVERGFAPDASTVTVVGSLSTWSMNTHARDADDLLRVITDTMAYPAGSDYVHGGEPWLILSPEHAQILKQAGLSKADVKRRLWEQSKMSASRLAAKDFARTNEIRHTELGPLTKDSLLPISHTPDDISILVAGGAGTHSVYVPSGHMRSVTNVITEG